MTNMIAISWFLIGILVGFGVGLLLIRRLVIAGLSNPRAVRMIVERLRAKGHF